MGIVKNIDPDSYAQVSKVAILDTGDVLGLSTSGAIIPERPIILPESSLLQVGSNELISNLNSEFVQGRQPGTNPGDIAIVGDVPTPAITDTTISGLTNANLSGSAGITNANLANSSLTVGTTGPLSGGGSVALGGTLTLTCPTCLTGTSSFTVSSTDTLTNKTISGGSNTITGLTAANLTAGDYSSKITGGTYSIDITGSVTSATNFSGSLIGDVTGTQGSTTVAKINGAVLGTTTATSGNLLIGNGTQWETKGLSNDATIDSSGALTLKNVGTSGTYGSSSLIPVLTTDAQGRVSAVINTAISGLTAANLSAGDFSGKITSGTYSINISGNSATATNFSGSLSGDVSGTQTTTSVDKIKGTALGSTTATSGNLLIASGTQWVTKSLSNDATIDSAGVLTLKNTGTAGTYGSALNIPVFVTDAQGRVTGVTNTAISGLTNSNLSGSAGITNANLLNSSITTAGNSGSGSVSLGGGLTFTGGGITNIVASGSTLTITSTEADSLSSVTGRGASTSTALTLNGGVTTTTSTALTLDSGTTGAVSIGTGSNAKTVTIGNTTGATALNLNAGTGNISFTVDGTSSSGKVQIGNSGTATPDLLVLDNGTSDPTGVNGGMYYNTGTGKFRCYENSAWKNCDASIPRSSSIVDSTTETLTTSEANILDGTAPSITPQSTSNRILINGSVRIGITANDSETVTIRIRRGSSGCAGTQVDSDLTLLEVGNNSSDAPDTGYISFSFIDSPSTTSSQSYTVCGLTSTATTSDTTPYITMTLIEIASTGADLAELYSTNDNTIAPGDVISLDSSLQAGVKKSIGAYDRNVLGIVSTRPGLTIGSIEGEGEGVKVVPVALSGRVPVKVFSQNGKINAGDYLTTSSIPGVAMKSTKSGAIIATAMTSFEGEGIGQILAFVKNGSSIVSGDVLTLLLSKPKRQLEVENIDISSTQPIDAGNVIETDIVGYITQIVSDLFKNTVEFFGKAFFHGDVAFLGQPTFNKDTAGHALIKQDATEVNIDFNKEYARKPVVNISVNLSGTVKPDEVPAYSVYDLSTKGFKIKLSRPAGFDLDFSWIALGVNEDNESESGVSAAPVLSPSPSQEIIPSPTVTPSASSKRVELASPSAQTL